MTAIKTDGQWRVMRFETEDGKYCELASNHVGPEQVPVPDGYRFVRSTLMVPAAAAGVEVTDRMVDAACRAYEQDFPSGWPTASEESVRRRMRAALTAALNQEDSP